MSAPPTRTVSTTASRLPVGDPGAVRAVQILWLVLLVFALAQLPIRIPEYLRNCGCPAPIAGVWDDMGIAQGVRAAFTLSAAVQFVLSIGLGGLLIFRRGNDRTAVVFAFIFLALANGAIPARDAIASDWWLLLHRFSQYWRFTGLALILYLFPTGRFSPRWAGLGAAAVAVLNLAGFVPGSAGWVSTALLLSNVITLIGGLGSMVYRYRHSAQIQRQQMKWLMIVVIVLIVYLSIYTASLVLLSTEAQALLTIGLDIMAIIIAALIPVTVALALFRYRLFEIDLVINRSLVAGLVTAVLLIMFGALFVPLQAVLGALLGSDRQMIAAAVAGGMVAVLFNPTRRFVREVIDRRLYGLRFNLDELNIAQSVKPEIQNPGYYTGRTLGGYEVLGLLGRGGMGEVYKGYGDSQTVAIKTIPLDLAQEAHYRARFEREAETLRRMQHRYIVRFLSSGADDEVYYIVMDYVEGRELRQMLGENRPLPPAEVLPLLTMLAEALDYAHAQGIVHRDLKPSNVMLRRPPNSTRDEAVLMDFGVARIQDAATAITGSGAIGTIDYMAPEQILEARAVDHRADIYALGVIVYEMFTGEKLFKGGPGQVMFAHLQQPAPDARDVVPDMPKDVARALQRALAKTPAERFDSVSAFIGAVQAGFAYT